VSSDSDAFFVGELLETGVAVDVQDVFECSKRWSEANTFLHNRSYSDSSHRHAPPTQPASVERQKLTP
jgi:hypothetical protein